MHAPDQGRILSGRLAEMVFGGAGFGVVVVVLAVAGVK